MREREPFVHSGRSLTRDDIENRLLDLVLTTNQQVTITNMARRLPAGTLFEVVGIAALRVHRREKRHA